MNQYNQKWTVFSCLSKAALMLHRRIILTLLEQFIRDLFSKHPQKVFRDHMMVFADIAAIQQVGLSLFQ